MNALQLSGYVATETPTAQGTNWVISANGRMVSVFCTFDGYWDVQGDNGRYLYQGRDGRAAANAVRGYLG